MTLDNQHSVDGTAKMNGKPLHIGVGLIIFSMNYYYITHNPESYYFYLLLRSAGKFCH